MSSWHAIGPTSAPHYPNAAVAAWCAIGAQQAMERRRRFAAHTAARNAQLFWSIAERQGLVVQ